ncbi:MAG: hypothetical protein IJ363_01860 [Clostridia bacterium]|nr:hypothetical protein [Clostridia bacterium]
MKRNTPLIILLVTYLLRVMLPLTNAVYFISELTLSRSGLWTTLYILSLLLEVGALVILAMGIQDPLYRRVGAYVTFGLPGLHYAVTLATFILLPAARQFIGPVFMAVLTAVYAFTAAMAYLTLRSADGMEPSDRKTLSPEEINARVEDLHDRLNTNS